MLDTMATVWGTAATATIAIPLVLPGAFVEHSVSSNSSPIEEVRLLRTSDGGLVVPRFHKTLDSSSPFQSVGEASSGVDPFAERTAWSTASYARLKSLSAKQDGWAGEGTRGPSREAILDAETLIEKLVHSGVVAAPRIGLDDDGAFSFSWKAEGLVGDLSIYGDGEYSFFVRRDGEAHSSDGAELAGQLDASLVEALSS